MSVPSNFAIKNKGRLSYNSPGFNKLIGTSFLNSSINSPNLISSKCVRYGIPATLQDSIISLADFRYMGLAISTNFLISIFKFSLSFIINHSFSSVFRGETRTVTPLSVISASQLRLSPDFTSNNLTNAFGIVISIDPLFSLILVLKVIFMLPPIVFPIYISVIFPFIYITIYINIKTEGLYASLTIINYTKGNAEGIKEV